VAAQSKVYMVLDHLNMDQEFVSYSLHGYLHFSVLFCDAEGLAVVLSPIQRVPSFVLIRI